MHIERTFATRELLAFDSLNSEETDRKPQYQEKPQNDHLGFLNDSLVFCFTVGSIIKPCVTVTESDDAIFIKKSCMRIQIIWAKAHK